MCGRYTLTSPAEAVAQLFGLDVTPNLRARYNIAPAQEVFGARISPQGGREGTNFRWGLIPSWAKDMAIGNRMINARAETARAKPAYRAAFKSRRCLVAADGFYEWQKPKPGQKAKQPYWITLSDKQPFAFAGLWERWQASDRETIDSCTIVTCPANDYVAPIHLRMPVILASDDHSQWLDGSPDQAAILMQPYAGGAMTARPVSTYVNSPRNDDENCIAALLV